MTAKTVFISYSTDDQAFAEDLRRIMESLGVAVEDPMTSMPSGSEWAKSIRHSLEQADAVVLVVPRAGTRGANNAFFEAGAAHALGKLVLAVVPEQRGLRELPSDVLNLAVMDASKQPMEAVAKTLVHALDAA
jgi:nucleoside 2-deoxyribosyltransferase